MIEVTAERWKDIAGYEGYYQVSDKGRVKSLKRLVIGKNGRPLTVHEKILRGNHDRSGYVYVVLQKDGVRKTLKAHRLVAQAFIENPSNLPQVNHINGQKCDNRLDNLEWVTANENQTHRYHVLKRQKDVHGRPRGVYKSSTKGRWMAIIKHHGETRNIGTFLDKEEAYKRYYDVYKQVHGYEPWDLTEHPTHQ